MEFKGVIKGMTEKQTLAKQRREEAKNEKKRLADLQKGSNELVSKASKVVTSVEPLLGKLEKAWANYESDKGKGECNIDEMTVENLKDKVDWAKTIIAESQKLLKHISSGKVADKKDYETLDHSDIGPEVKSCNSVLKALAYAKKAAKKEAKGGA